MKKRFLACLLAALLLAACLPLPAFAAEGGFVIENGILTKYNGPGGGVTIPDGVTSIGDYAFYKCEDITSVVIPNGVTRIGFNAFNMCGNLTKVVLPDTLAEIGAQSFKECAFSTITIPDSVKTIGEFAFAYCPNLTTVTIPSSVALIGGEVSSSSAFWSCKSLTGIYVDEGNSVYSSMDGVLYTKAQDELLVYPCGRQGHFTMPYGATAIGNQAFKACEGLTGITIPDSVDIIGPSAFSGCTGLAEVALPNSVTTIELLAFSNCAGLASITIPNSVTTIGGSAFWGCDNLANLTIPDSVTEVGGEAFAFCYKLADIAIPDGITSIGQKTFYYCTGLATITIPATVTSIGYEAFRGCDSLQDVYYSGTKEQWEKVSIESGNDALANATLHCTGKPEEPTPPPVDPGAVFTDVPADAYYFKPVSWAVEAGITNGAGAGKFNPNGSCTRGQIVTFLWRAAGSPQPTGEANPFTDVKPSDYFYKPVLWAVENQVTGGTGAGTFSPGRPCTRDQAVTFLWRAAGKPSASGSSAFTDVPAGSYYEGAVNWAVENGITTGAGAGRFNPGGACTRGQIVTFLYRDMGAA